MHRKKLVESHINLIDNDEERKDLTAIASRAKTASACEEQGYEAERIREETPCSDWTGELS